MDKQARLDELKQKLKDLKASLPEHCYGSDGYIDVHRASPEHWEKIEAIEDEIKELKAELGV